MTETAQPNGVDIDHVMAQLDELAKVRLHSRAQQLRRQIQQEITALLLELKEEGETPQSSEVVEDSES